MKTAQITRILIGLALVLAVSMVIPMPPAHAASRNGACDSGEFCYYYNSNNAGSISDFPAELLSLANYGTDPATCYVFMTKGRSGYNQCIKNSAASVWNRTSETVIVYYNSNYDASVASQAVAPGFKGNLSSQLKNNNASHRAQSTGEPPAHPGPYPPVVRTLHQEWAGEGKCLDSDYTGEVYMIDCNGGNYQKWIMYKRVGVGGEDPMVIQNVQTGLCLDARDRDWNTTEDVYTHPCNGGERQLWHDLGAGLDLREPGVRARLMNDYYNNCMNALSRGTDGVKWWPYLGDTCAPDGWGLQWWSRRV
ncbi:hypothetical protein JOD57_003496 [Geodermatophilus bullaregiensis]|uniref:peptidase inhibitor family I36 protein n=1 Tax=Geodermatophilus bullaregiensis TaxID=1564160 RepID=UPI001956CD23|nr:peptidase inhibitor family I36 protein [Geodermatophilus bullaregiensis]MBM7807659.1 hypothetical protein [Geodermatophilus bullaregiensis]